MNKVILIGNVGQDPDVKTLNGGSTTASFSVATTEHWVDRDGQKQTKTEWTKIVTWGRLAETCAKYVSKGMKVAVEGKLQTRSWEDQQGQKKYATEVVASHVEFLTRAQSESFASFDTNEDIPF